MCRKLFHFLLRDEDQWWRLAVLKQGGLRASSLCGSRMAGGDACRMVGGGQLCRSRAAQQRLVRGGMQWCGLRRTADGNSRVEANYAGAGRLSIGLQGGRW